ncbi:probable serine/threonine-protein kinase kinX [Chironomus tepperi]|uniref:probable serine/threonine-protein kinase kinX n=1 Tax=Chironomus tepperi TaxID=113505 RepID=UPI00391F5366
MSQHSENDSDDDDCEYFLQPVSNQYNISDKIKEANQQLYKSEHSQRSQPKVRFRDHQLVDYEPEDENGIKMMERRRSSQLSNISFKKEEESSDDGYIDDDVFDPSTEERLIIETIEIEEVCEEIEVLDISDNNNRAFANGINESLDIEEAKYEEDEFYKDDDIRDATMSTDNIIKSESREKSSSAKRKFHTRINPIGNIPVDERRTRTKKCCEFKETDEYKQKLPKYNGFYSHYGLSKDEIERREEKLRKNVEVYRRRSSQHFEKQDNIAKANEEAFAKWLQKKMCNPMSRSNPINMYDMKPNFKKKQQSHKLPQRKHRFTIQRQMETEEQDDDDDDDDGEQIDDDEEVDDEEVDEESKTEQDEDDDDLDIENNEYAVPEPSDENGNEQENEQPEDEHNEIHICDENLTKPLI